MKSIWVIPVIASFLILGTLGLSDDAFAFTETSKITASDGADGDLFAYAETISIDGDTAIVGAWGDDDDGANSGSAYIFDRDPITGVWSETVKLTASDIAAGDGFGSRLKILGDTAIVASAFDDDKGFDSGSAYVFDRDPITGVWSETVKLTASDGTAGDTFGFSVSMSGFTVIIGAPGDDDKGIDSGSAYIFDRIPPNSSPVCTDVTASQDSLWPPNHKFVNIGVNGVTDPDGDTVSITVTGIAQDEAVDAKGSGNTSPDGEIDEDTAKVRAERSGKDDGRVYEISFTAMMAMAECVRALY